MKLRVINPEQVIELLPTAECIEVVDAAMRCAADREAQMPLRSKMALPRQGLLVWMPGYMADPEVFGVKLVGVFPGNFALDGPAVARSRLFVDLREGALAQAGEFQMARDEGLIDDDHILGEVGEVALGRVEGRTGRDDITLYKSLGLVVQDLASAYHVYRKAEEQDVGVTSDF